MSESDDWNLYEWHVHLHDDCYLTKYPNGGGPVIVHPEWYKGKDVGILRKKLIEDLCSELLKHGARAANDRISQEEILAVINKRFGG